MVKARGSRLVVLAEFVVVVVRSIKLARIVPRRSQSCQRRLAGQWSSVLRGRVAVAAGSAAVGAAGRLSGAVGRGRCRRRFLRLRLRHRRA